MILDYFEEKHNNKFYINAVYMVFVRLHSHFILGMLEEVYVGSIP